MVQAIDCRFKQILVNYGLGLNSNLVKFMHMHKYLVYIKYSETSEG